MDKISQKKSIETNKGFQNFIRPYMTNKGMITRNDITLIDGKNVTQMIMKFQRNLTNAILTLTKKDTQTSLVKQVPRQGV